MYEQVYDPVGSSLGLSSVFALLPIVVLLVLLGGSRLRAQWAALSALGAGLAVAVLVYGMPIGQAALSAGEGAAFALWPVLWIVVNAVCIFTMTVRSGHFDVLRRAISAVSEDHRIQAVIVAFSFGALLEALAGFGTPAAIAAVMLIGLGFPPVKAVAVALVGNAAAVPFGAVGIPIITLAGVTGLPSDELGAMVGRQTPFLALVVPLVVVFMVDGRRGLAEAWPAAVVAGAAFALAQFIASNHLSVGLTDVIASLCSIGAMVAFLRVWRSSQEMRVRARSPVSGRETLVALAPYLIMIATLSLAQAGPVKRLLAGATQEFEWLGLDVRASGGEALTATTFRFDPLAATGSLLLLSGLVTMLVLRISPRTALASYRDTLGRLGWAFVTVASVLALAYVMNFSGQTVTLGRWLAGAGALVALLSPMIGWLGMTITGSDTASNALFGALQVTAAHDAGLSPTLLAAANSSGGVVGKMLSPQHLAIGAAAAGIAGREGDVLRVVLRWSLILLAASCVLVYLQSTDILGWMVPGP